MESTCSIRPRRWSLTRSALCSLSWLCCTSSSFVKDFSMDSTTNKGHPQPTATGTSSNKVSTLVVREHSAPLWRRRCPKNHSLHKTSTIKTTKLHCCKTTMETTSVTTSSMTLEAPTTNSSPFFQPLPMVRSSSSSSSLSTLSCQGGDTTTATTKAPTVTKTHPPSVGNDCRPVSNRHPSNQRPKQQSSASSFSSAAYLLWNTRNQQKRARQRRTVLRQQQEEQRQRLESDGALDLGTAPMIPPRRRATSSPASAAALQELWQADDLTTVSPLDRPVDSALVISSKEKHPVPPYSRTSPRSHRRTPSLESAYYSTVAHCGDDVL